MRYAIAIVLLATILGRTVAAEPAAVIGAGTHTCGQFAESYRKAPGTIEDAYFTWALGFMGGINTMLVLKKESFYDLRAKSLSAQKAHIRSFCNRKPLASYAEAIFDLLSSLPQGK